MTVTTWNDGKSGSQLLFSISYAAIRRMENYYEYVRLFHSLSVCIYIYIRLRACYYPDPIRIKYQKPSVSREKEMGLWSSSSRIMRALQKK